MIPYFTDWSWNDEKKFHLHLQKKYKGERVMTKFSDDFIKKVQDYYHAEKKKKKFQGDKHSL